MAQHEEHGGGCCGASHLYAFGPDAEREFRQIDQIIEDQLDYLREENDIPPGGYCNHLFEIVLTDQQCTPEYITALKARKFRHVARWYNSNSGNYCNKFCRFGKAKKKRPFAY